ncbi:hypothetical protein [Sphingomonas bacterium]|uniref:hypothetical protein n=1 Tax=Sphingomonas bacterium TaxID=1895847 RepID=UPI00157753A1|nr:hypothetical protein [Sphingomonas bacterium]
MAAKLDLVIRSERRAIFGTDVSAPDNWDIILILYLADAEGERLTGRETIERTGGCPEAGRRRIAHLSHSGMIAGDIHGSADDVVTLAPAAITKVERWLDHAWARIQST